MTTKRDNDTIQPINRVPSEINLSAISFNDNVPTQLEQTNPNKLSGSNDGTSAKKITFEKSGND